LPTPVQPPLHDTLCELEQTWREWDDGFVQSLDRGDPSLAIAVEQTRCFARHALSLASERAMPSSLRIALVRERLWTPAQALTSCLRYHPNQCGQLIELLEVLPDPLVFELIEHTRSRRWRRHVPLDHPGVWVNKRAGGESLSVQLCARLVAMNRAHEAKQLFAELGHVGARIDALESVRALLSPDELADALVETLARSRALDPVRRHYALCAVSRLYPPAQALPLVEEAIAGLPPGHDWTHAPGGLMLMLLAEPVIEALDRDGLREQLIAWAEREGERLWNNLLDGHAERLAAVTGRPFDEPSPASDDPHAQQALARAEHGDPNPLLANYEAVPDRDVPRAVELVQAVARAEPEKPWHVLVLLKLAARARALGQPCGEPTLAVVDEHLSSVRWHQYTYPEPVWCHSEFMLFSAATRRRVLLEAIDGVRASASRLDVDRQVDALKYVQARMDPASSSEPAELGARWLAEAREDADPGRPTPVIERWRVARELWGAAGLDALLAALVGVE